MRPPRVEERAEGVRERAREREFSFPLLFSRLNISLERTLKFSLPNENARERAREIRTQGIDSEIDVPVTVGI